MPRSIKAITNANQKPKTTGSPTPIIASSKLGTSGTRAQKGGGVQGKSGPLKV
jgi:hypothetical protein